MHGFLGGNGSVEAATIRMLLGLAAATPGRRQALAVGEARQRVIEIGQEDGGLFLGVVAAVDLPAGTFRRRDAP